MSFKLFASPWWVNLFILIPPIIYLSFRKRRALLTKRSLILTALIAISFGLVDGSSVTYLRGAAGILPGQEAINIVSQVSRHLFNVEQVREFASFILFIWVALLGARKLRESVALYFWMIGWWVACYYLTLHLFAQWPHSLVNNDVLGNLPAITYSQVWYPLLFSILMTVSVLLTTKFTKPGGNN